MVSRSILLPLPPPHQTMRQRPGWTIVRKMRTCQTLTLKMSGINPPRFSRWVNTVFPAVILVKGLAGTHANTVFTAVTMHAT